MRVEEIAKSEKRLFGNFAYICYDRYTDSIWAGTNETFHGLPGFSDGTWLHGQLRNFNLDLVEQPVPETLEKRLKNPLSIGAREEGLLFADTQKPGITLLSRDGKIEREVIEPDNDDTKSWPLEIAVHDGNIATVWGYQDGDGSLYVHPGPTTIMLKQNIAIYAIALDDVGYYVQRDLEEGNETFTCFAFSPDIHYHVNPLFEIEAQGPVKAMSVLKDYLFFLDDTGMLHVYDKSGSHVHDENLHAELCSDIAVVDQGEQALLYLATPHKEVRSFLIQE